MSGGVVILVVLVVVFLVAAILKARAEPAFLFPYRKVDALFTPAERSFYGVLIQAIGDDFVAFGKVRVADVLVASDEFMDHIVTQTQEMVERIKHGEIPDEAFSTLKQPCPRCGGVIQENYKKFQCKSCDFALWKVVASRQYEPEEVEELLEKRVVGPLQGFRSKMGRPFAAIIKLNAELQPEFDFGQSNENADEEVDFSDQEPLGRCPKCGAGIYEHGMAYLCEKSVGPAKTCDFRSGKVILQQAVERAQMQKLLATGKTDLLKEFVSSRTKRKFSAYLVRGNDGKVGFEFEPRAPKVTKAGAVAKPEKAAPAAPPAKPAKTPAAKTKKSAPLKTAAPAKPAARKRETKK